MEGLSFVTDSFDVLLAQRAARRKTIIFVKIPQLHRLIEGRGDSNAESLLQQQILSIKITKIGGHIMGTYVRNNLGRNEHVVYEAKHSWVIFVSFRALFTLFLAPLIDRWTSEFAITNRRVIIKVGLFRRRTLEMNLSKIESIHVNQSILGRIFRYGDIVVVGSGGTREPFAFIGAPIKFRRAYQNAEADLYQHGDALRS